MSVLCRHDYGTMIMISILISTTGLSQGSRQRHDNGGIGDDDEAEDRDDNDDGPNIAMPPGSILSACGSDAASATNTRSGCKMSWF